MKKRIVSLLLTLCLLCGLVPLSVNATASAWSEAYRNFVLYQNYLAFSGPNYSDKQPFFDTVLIRESGSGRINHYLFDLDKDGCPELIVPYNAISQGGQNYHVFTFLSDQVVYLGNVGGFILRFDTTGQFPGLFGGTPYQSGCTYYLTKRGAELVRTPLISNNDNAVLTNDDTLVKAYNYSTNYLGGISARLPHYTYDWIKQNGWDKFVLNSGYPQALSGEGSQQMITLIRNLDLFPYSNGKHNIALADINGDGLMEVLASVSLSEANGGKSEVGAKVELYGWINGTVRKIAVLNDYVTTDQSVIYYYLAKKGKLHSSGLRSSADGGFIFREYSLSASGELSNRVVFSSSNFHEDGRGRVPRVNGVEVSDYETVMKMEDDFEKQNEVGLLLKPGKGAIYSSENDLGMTRSQAIQYFQNLPTRFLDIASSKYYTQSVQWAVSRGVTSGTEEYRFSPNQPCTRAQAVTFLWNAAGKPDVGTTDKFLDVKPTSWYAKAVAWAVQNNITAGISADHFGPGHTCTRGQIVTFMYRAANSPAVSNTGSQFADVRAGKFYEQPVAWAVQNKITSGVSSSSFAPDNECTRAQIVTFLYRDMA